MDKDPSADANSFVRRYGRTMDELIKEAEGVLPELFKNPTHAEKHGFFQSGEAMYPCFVHEGKYYPSAYHWESPTLNLDDLQHRWWDTDAALLWVHMGINNRQSEIDKKLYMQDDKLERLRNRSRAIGRVRIELCTQRITHEKRLAHRGRLQ